MPKQQRMRHTRQSIVERTQREFEQLDALVRGLRPTDWQLRVPRPETRAPWTVKDALAHIVYWKAHTARVFRGERRPAEVRGLEVPQLNQVIYEQWRDRSPGDVLEWHRQVHADVMRTLNELPDDWFGRREHLAAWPADFDGHSAGHRVDDIEAALTSKPRATRA
jgi:hypothetical protein